ncbi:MAG: hypothetical protein ACK2VA_04955 [Anaerolineae bacterium]
MIRWLRQHWPDLIAVGLLLLATLAFHWPLITPDAAARQSYPEGDFYNQFYTFAAYEHDRLWTGQLPLWNPYAYGGHPFLADVQAAVFYPPSLLVMLLSGPGRFAPQWLIVEVIAHFVLGAILTYAFVRRLTAPFGRYPSIVASLLSALTFTFGGYLTGYPPQQLAILETQVWLPLILLLLDVGLVERRWGAVAGAGLVWGVALLAGHPQSAMYVFYAALAYGIFCAWRAKLPWYRAAAAQVAWASAGVSVAAVQLLPSLEFMRLSVRASLPYETLAAGFSLHDLAQALLPGLYTQWSPAYVGILPLALAGVACLGAVAERSKRRWPAHVAFWVGLTLVSAVLSLGGKAFLYRLFYWVVPGFRLFRSQERAIYLASFSLAVLVGYGWAWLSSAEAGERWVRRARVGLLSFALLPTAAAAVWGAANATGLAGEGSLFPGKLLRWALLGWAGWAAVRWLGGRRPWGGLLATALVVADLFSANMTVSLAPGGAAQRIYEGTWLAPMLEDEGRFRIVNDFGLPGNAGCWLRLEDMAGASPLRLQAHKVMVDAVPRWRMWQLFDVRYVSTWEHDLPGPFPATRIAMLGPEWEKNTAYLHRLGPDFARAWVVYGAQEADGLQALEVMSAPDWDPFAEVLLVEPVAVRPEVPAASPSAADVVRYAPEEIVVQADLDAPGWLVLGEWYYPGWLAWVDGEREIVLRADYGLRAVPLEAGPHEVVLRFRPTSVTVGGLISGASLLFVLLAMLWWRRRAVR